MRDSCEVIAGSDSSVGITVGAVDGCAAEAVPGGLPAGAGSSATRCGSAAAASSGSRWQLLRR